MKHVSKHPLKTPKFRLDKNRMTEKLNKSSEVLDKSELIKMTGRELKFRTEI